MLPPFILRDNVTRLYLPNGGLSGNVTIMYLLDNLSKTIFTNAKAFFDICKEKLVL